MFLKKIENYRCKTGKRNKDSANANCKRWQIVNTLNCKILKSYSLDKQPKQKQIN